MAETIVEGIFDLRNVLFVQQNIQLEVKVCPFVLFPHKGFQKTLLVIFV